MTDEAETQSLVVEMRQLRADFARIADTLQAMVRQRGGEALGTAEDAAHKLLEEARRRTEGLAREIEQKPVTTALGAFGLGVVLGALFSARRG